VILEGSLRIEVDGRSEADCRAKAIDVARAFFEERRFTIWLEQAITRTVQTGDGHVVAATFEATYKARLTD